MSATHIDELMNLVQDRQQNPMLLGAEPSADETKLLLISKICFIFVIFGIALGFGVLPAKVKSCGRNPRFMSMANSFSGGLFLAIALIHILPDVIKDYEDYLHPDPPTIITYTKSGRPKLTHGEEGPEIPLPFMLVFCGYTFILLVDKVMFDSHALFGGHDHGGHGHGNEEEGHDHGVKKEHKHGHGDGHDHEHGKKEHGHGHGDGHKHGDPKLKGHEHAHDHQQCLIQHESTPVTQNNYLPEGKDHKGSVGSSHSSKDHYTDPAAAKLINNIKRSMIAVSNEVVRKTYGKGQLAVMEEKMIQESVQAYLSKADQFATRISNIYRASHLENKAHEEQQNLFVDSGNVSLAGKTTPAAQAKEEKEPFNFLPFVLMIALSVHSIFEGLALGLMKEFKPFLNLMISIMVHKFAEAMSISIAMQKAGFEFNKLLKFMFLFAFATPLGTSLGIALNSAPEMVSIVFTSLAGGSFIYVSCSELIVEEFSLPGNRWLKLFAFLLGATFIGLLLLLE